MTFKISYKGTSCRGIKYIYICPSCEWEQIEVHGAEEEPEIHCTACGCRQYKKPAAPAFDADMHDAMLSHSIGGDFE